MLAKPYVTGISTRPPRIVRADPNGRHTENDEVNVLAHPVRHYPHLGSPFQNEKGAPTGPLSHYAVDHNVGCGFQGNASSDGAKLCPNCGKPADGGK